MCQKPSAGLSCSSGLQEDGACEATETSWALTVPLVREEAAMRSLKVTAAHRPSVGSCCPWHTGRCADRLADRLGTWSERRGGMGVGARPPFEGLVESPAAMGRAFPAEVSGERAEGSARAGGTGVPSGPEQKQMGPERVPCSQALSCGCFAATHGPEAGPWREPRPQGATRSPLWCWPALTPGPDRTSRRSGVQYDGIAFQP